jgi:hypothetical protein
MWYEGIYRQQSDVKLTELPTIAVVAYSPLQFRLDGEL